MMKLRNRRRTILTCILSNRSLLREVEEMRVGQLGTTIYDDDLKDQEDTPAESVEDQYNLKHIDNQKLTEYPSASRIGWTTLHQSSSRMNNIENAGLMEKRKVSRCLRRSV